MDGPFLVAILSAAAALALLCLFIACRSGRTPRLRGRVATTPPTHRERNCEVFVLFGLPTAVCLLLGVSGIAGMIGLQDIGYDAPGIVKTVFALLLLIGTLMIPKPWRMHRLDEGWYPAWARRTVR